MTPLADLSASIAGWSAIVAGRSDAAQQFRADRAGILVAALWLLVGMLLSVAVQSAMYGLPHVVSVLFSLIGEAVTLGLLWLGSLPEDKWWALSVHHESCCKLDS